MLHQSLAHSEALQAILWRMYQFYPAVRFEDSNEPDGHSTYPKVFIKWKSSTEGFLHSASFISSSLIADIFFETPRKTGTWLDDIGECSESP